MIDRDDPRDRLSFLYLSLFKLTFLRMMLRLLMFQRWVLRTYYYLVHGIDKRPPPRPTQHDLRDMYG